MVYKSEDENEDFCLFKLHASFSCSLSRGMDRNFILDWLPPLIVFNFGKSQIN